MEDFVSLAAGGLWRLQASAEVPAQTQPALSAAAELPSQRSPVPTLPPVAGPAASSPVQTAEASVPQAPGDTSAEPDIVAGWRQWALRNKGAGKGAWGEGAGLWPWLDAIAGKLAQKGRGKGEGASKPDAAGQHDWASAGPGQQLGGTPASRAPEREAAELAQPSDESLTESGIGDGQGATAATEPQDKSGWEAAGPGQQLGGRAAPDGEQISEEERRLRAMQATLQRQVSLPGVSVEKAQELRERQQKDELLGKLGEHYNRQGLVMPMGLNAATAEQLRRHWEHVRRGDTAAQLLNA